MYVGFSISSIVMTINSPWAMVTSLQHQCSHGEPEGVGQCELILNHVSKCQRQIVPFVGTESAYKKDADAYDDVCYSYACPQLNGKRLHKGKDTRLLFVRSLYHYANSHVHEGFREVDHPLAFRCDC